MASLGSLFLVLLCSQAIAARPTGDSDVQPSTSTPGSQPVSFEVHFEGNEELSNRQLKRVIDNPQYEDYSRYLVDDLVEAVEDFYRSKGFAEAKVKGNDRAADRKHIIEIQIEEGTLYHVTEVEIHGNREYSDDDLSKLLKQYPGTFFKVPFDLSDVESDRGRLRDYYIGRGYLDAIVKGSENLNSEDGSAAIEHSIEEGKQYRLVQLRFTGNEVFSSTEFLQFIDIGSNEVYRPFETSAALAKLTDHYRRYGYAYCEIKPDVSIDPQAGEVRVAFQVDEGKKVLIGDISLSGNKETKSSLIWREVDLKKGEPYSRSKLFDTRSNLFALGVFSKVTVEPSPHLNGSATADIAIEVEEGKQGRLRPAIGYGTSEGPRLSIQASYGNLFGRAHEIGFSGEITGIGDSEQLYYRIGNLYGTGVDFRWQVFHRTLEEPSFDVERFGTELLIEKEIGRRWTLTANYLLEDVSLSNVEVIPEEAGLREEGMVGRLGSELVYDSRDSAIDPHRGTRSSIRLDLAAAAFGSEFDYIKSEMSTAWFLPVTSWSTVALSARGGWLEPFGQSDDSPLWERFLIGGDYTVRGFPRDEIGPRDSQGEFIGGDAMLIFNAEYRFPIYKSIRGAFFYDTGNAWRDFSDIDLGDMRESVGAGIRYVSPVAAVRLDYGHVLDPLPDEDDWAIHFSIGHAF